MYRAWSHVCLSVCLSVMPSITLMHPAKAVRRNEMPFGRDARVVPSNTLLDSGPGPLREGEIWRSEPQSKFALQIAARSLGITERLL